MYDSFLSFVISFPIYTKKDKKILKVSMSKQRSKFGTHEKNSTALKEVIEEADDNELQINELKKIVAQNEAIMYSLASQLDIAMNMINDNSQTNNDITAIKEHLGFLTGFSTL